MKSTSVVLGKAQMAFIRRQVRKGRFSSASEAVRAGLELLQKQDLRMKQLRAALREGEMSDEPVSFDIEGFIAKKKAAARKPRA
ncbi:type II toxin-antitoxin system ParD family antitoxin [Taklimakanibacter deserti]|uniref:type II toxin-antitoxin system ParD family antitoxin n=1 Tax=Taklimakanibacter deserti TaxID=2267839 RepID=UPI000E65B04C